MKSRKTLFFIFKKEKEKRKKVLKATMMVDDGLKVYHIRKSKDDNPSELIKR